MSEVKRRPQTRSQTCLNEQFIVSNADKQKECPLRILIVAPLYYELPIGRKHLSIGYVNDICNNRAGYSWMRPCKLDDEITEAIFKQRREELFPDGFTFAAWNEMLDAKCDDDAFVIRCLTDIAFETAIYYGNLAPDGVKVLPKHKHSPLDL